MWRWRVTCRGPQASVAKFWLELDAWTPCEQSLRNNLQCQSRSLYYTVYVGILTDSKAEDMPEMEVGERKWGDRRVGAVV